MRDIQPSLRDLCKAGFDPALKRRAIVMMSLRDGESGVAYSLWVDAL